MKYLSSILCIAFIFLMLGTVQGKDNQAEYNKYWPTWRGPLVTGEALTGKPPVEWSESKNIRWKISIPGKGLSSPVIWGSQIFITTAVGIDKTADPEKIKAQKGNRPMWMKASGMAKSTEHFQQFIVMSINRKDGKILWQKTVREEFPHEGTHKDGSWASNSCVTDGKHVIAFFGSYGVYCFDMKGNLTWEKDLGDMKTRNAFGEGSSPALYQNYVIVNWDHEGNSFIIVLDKITGETIWKKDRNERTSWSTPVVVNVNGKPQVIVAATEKSRGYDITNGELIWELGGMTKNVIPTPVYSDGIVYLMSGFRGSALQAVKLDRAKGDILNTEAVVWTYDQNTPYTPSSLLYKGKLYFVKGNKASLTCADAKTGDIHYTKQKLDGMKGVYASPVGANNCVYIAGRNGVVYVIKPGTQFEVLAKNTLEDGFDASPAVVDNELYLRGIKYLYCIAEK